MKGARGFTLVELLVALAIGAGVVLVAGQALVANASLTGRVGLELREQEFRRRALRLIGLDLAHARGVSAAPQAEVASCGGGERTAVLHLALGDNASACEHAERVYFTPALLAQALAVGLAAGAAVRFEAQALLAGGRLAASQQALLARALAGTTVDTPRT